MLRTVKKSVLVFNTVMYLKQLNKIEFAESLITTITNWRQSFAALQCATKNTYNNDYVSSLRLVGCLLAARLGQLESCLLVVAVTSAGICG